MATDIIIPKIGFSMTEGVLSGWLAQDGATVKVGDPLFEVESDKSNNEVEAPVSGTLKISGVAGETYPVGTVIGTIE